MNRFVLSGLVITTLLAGTSSAHARIIDSFNTLPQNIIVETGGADDGSEAGTGDGSVLGGYRDIALTDVTGPAGLDAEIETVVDDGLLSIDNPPSVSSMSLITWDGSDNDPFDVDTTGLDGVDLAFNGNPGFYLELVYIDLNTTIGFQIWDMDGDTGTFSNTFAATADFFVPFAAFTNSGDIDFNNVGALQMSVSGAESFDTLIDFIETRGDVAPPPPEQIPAPGVVGLLGLGLLGLGLSRRRKG